jgi:hypothetical protein
MDPSSLEEGAAILRSMAEPDQNTPRAGSNKRTQARRRQRQRAKERTAADAKEDAAQDKRPGFARQIFKEMNRREQEVVVPAAAIRHVPANERHQDVPRPQFAIRSPPTQANGSRQYQTIPGPHPSLPCRPGGNGSVKQEPRPEPATNTHPIHPSRAPAFERSPISEREEDFEYESDPEFRTNYCNVCRNSKLCGGWVWMRTL